MRSMKLQFLPFRLFILLPILSFFLMLWVALEAYGDPWKNLQQGDKTAKELGKELEQKKKKAGPHPFYDEKKLKELNLSKTNLEGQSQREAQQNPARQMIMESVKERPQFTLDPLKDPLFKGSEKILDKPLSAIGGEETRANSFPGKTTTEVLT